MMGFAEVGNRLGRGKCEAPGVDSRFRGNDGAGARLTPVSSEGQA